MKRKKPRRNKPRVVVALGGNALIRRGEDADVDVQRHNVERATEALAALAQDYELVVTHGNGPQVGLLALQSEAYMTVSPYPLDVLGAETQGMIGYLLEQSLGNLLPRSAFATLLTQVVVDLDDPAFADPSKFVGPIYSEAEGRELSQSRGWVVKRDGDVFRRVVASPEPKRIVEIGTIRLLVDGGVTVICSGGGGIPVVEGQGVLHGVEAVVDKDLSAALLARELDADMFLLLTDVTAIQRGFGSNDASDIHHATPNMLRGLNLPAGSMGPKAEAACRFVESTGRPAAIGALEDAIAIVRGRAGTQVTEDGASTAPLPRKRRSPKGNFWNEDDRPSRGMPKGEQTMDDKVEAHSLIGLLERADARRAAELMVKDNIGAVGIYDGAANRVLGIVTERDIVHAVAKGRDLAKTCVKEIMTPDPITVDAPLTRDRARMIMNSAHIRHVIVRKDGGDHIVSLRDT